MLCLLLLSTACGAGEPATVVDQPDPVPSASVTAAPSTTPGPSASEGPSAAPADGILSEASTGETVRMRVGNSVQVDLPADYVAPRSNGTALRRESATGGYPTGEPVRAQFRASSAGTVELAAGTDYACLHTEPRCMLPQRSWTVSVVVTE